MVKKNFFHFSSKYALFFAIACLLLIVGGYFYYSSKKQAIENETISMLTNITNAKSKFIEDWYLDEKHDAYNISHNKFFQKTISAFLTNSNSQNTQELLDYIQHLVLEHDLAGFYLVEQSKVLVSSNNENFNQFPSDYLAIQSNAVYSTSIYQKQGSYYMSFIVPLEFASRSVYAVYELNIASILHPLMNILPYATYKTFESTIVEADSDSVVVLNKIKGLVVEQQSSLQHEIRVADIHAIYQVFETNNDIRSYIFQDKKLFALFYQVADTPWLLVSKVQKQEVYQGLQNQSIIVGVLLLLAFISFILTLAYIYNNIQKKNYKDLYSLQKLTQEEISKSKQLLQIILDTIPVRVFWKDKNLRYLGANKKFLRDLGYTDVQQLIGKSDYDLVWSNKVDMYLKDEVDVLEQSSPKIGFERTIPLEHKGSIIAKTSIIPFKDLSQRTIGIIGMYENITKQKELIQKIIDNEEIYRSQFEDHSAIKFLLDPQTGQIMNINKAAVSFYGWSKEEFLKMNIAQVNTLDKAGIDAVIQEAVKNKRNYLEVRHRKADGSVCDVEVYASPIIVKGKVMMHSIVHDVTDKKQSEKQIRLQSRAIEQSPVSIIITNSRGDIEYVNPKFTEVSGYAFSEVLGKNPSILKSGNQTSDFYKNLWETIVSGHDWSGELQNKRKNGELFWEQCIISPITDIKGAVTHYVAVKEDITEKKQMFEELIRAKEKAEESDRLKTAFLANMSHEIRTPMNGIIGFSEMLTENLDDEQRKEYARIIINSSKQLLSIVNDILDISRIEAGELVVHKEKFAINPLLYEIYTFFKPQMVKKGIEFTLHTPFADTDSYIETDKVRLRQILINLVGNAIKFTHKGSIEIGYTYINSILEFYVKDTGIGIASTMLEKVFDRFCQAEVDINKQYGGTGLGLSISQKLVELLGGTIHVESEMNEGTRFYFTLPHVGAFQKNKTAVPLDFDFKRAVVLIAEDNHTNFELLKANLDKNNLVILRASDGEEAIRMCLENPSIQFVLMDIQMPKIDGIKATREIKRFRPNLPIVMQSAYGEHNEKDLAIYAGCSDYISKPIKKQELLNCIAAYLIS